MAGACAPRRRHVFGVMDRLRTREEEFDPDQPQELTRPERAAFVRDATWRYVSYLDRGERELYRIEEDLLELVDLIDEHPERAAAMDAELTSWLAHVPLPEPSPTSLGITALSSTAWLRSRRRRRARAS